jgi:anti-anti-sigma factor
MATVNGEQTGIGRRRRFDRTIGFWLGGIVLTTAGCIIGATLPYEHPVGVVTSMIWWGIYAGASGASVGVLLGILAESIAAAPARAPDVEAPRLVVSAVPFARSDDPAGGLEVTAIPTANALVVRIQGVAGVSQSEALVSGLLATSARRPALVTLDLSELRFVSSLAVGVLMSYCRGVVRGGGRVALAARLQPEVQAALARNGLLELFVASLEAQAA